MVSADQQLLANAAKHTFGIPFIALSPALAKRIQHNGLIARLFRTFFAWKSTVDCVQPCYQLGSSDVASCQQHDRPLLDVDLPDRSQLRFHDRALAAHYLGNSSVANAGDGLARAGSYKAQVSTFGGSKVVDPPLGGGNFDVTVPVFDVSLVEGEFEETPGNGAQLVDGPLEFYSVQVVDAAAQATLVNMEAAVQATCVETAELAVQATLSFGIDAVAQTESVGGVLGVDSTDGSPVSECNMSPGSPRKPAASAAGEPRGWPDTRCAFGGAGPSVLMNAHDAEDDVDSMSYAQEQNFFRNVCWQYEKLGLLKS